jgi:hypothetical protein
MVHPNGTQFNKVRAARDLDRIAIVMHSVLTRQDESWGSWPIAAAFLATRHLLIFDRSISG